MYVNLIGYDLELNAYGKNKVRHYWHPPTATMPSCQCRRCYHVDTNNAIPPGTTMLFHRRRQRYPNEDDDAVPTRTTTLFHQ